MSEERGQDDILDLPTLVSVAKGLIGASEITPQEREVVDRYAVPVPGALIAAVGGAVRNSADPLGTAYSALKTPEQRRGMGQTFTPTEAVTGMFRWAESRGPVSRIVDPGAGSGRYVLTGLQRHPEAVGIASEADPLVALLLRANAHALGVQARLDIRLGDYRDLTLEPHPGRTLFIGNPPYVRHHGIPAVWKDWYSTRLKSLGHAASQLAGLHLHFFLHTLALARPGDLGCFLTAAEWLDVNYGQSLRDLLTNGLGGRAVFVVSPEVPLFGDALVSACITGFEPGSEDRHIEFRSIDRREQLLDLSGGRPAEKAEAKTERRWTTLLRSREAPPSEDFITLGDLFRVSRGQVTGKNSVWVAQDNRFGLPQEYLIPAITEASDIIRAPNGRIECLDALRRVVDLPVSLDDLGEEQKCPVLDFLVWARSEDADQGYIARHRKPWWRVNLKPAPQIVVTYMGRRPPVFAINSAGARLINVAHGLYPKVGLSDQAVENLVAWLNGNVRQSAGRVYAGGLTKFEPSEVMRLPVPGVDSLTAGGG